MPISDYWNALNSRQRSALLTGVVVVVGATIALGSWLLHDPIVALVSDLNEERLQEFEQQLDRAKVVYHIADDASTVLVARSEVGKARAAIDGHVGTPPAVGLELFKDTDFSSTDFAQRINYQRALQGELTRTIEAIADVRSARVHVILPEAGLLKRDSTKASAAVSVTMREHQSLSAAQVHGIQRLVAASIPQIGAQDVVVLDESGRSLTRAAAAEDGASDLSSVQLDLKREADEYLERKLIHLLQDIAPQASVSASVDAVLDERQVRVTTDEPIGQHKAKDGDAQTGVLLKERQSEHGHGAGQADGDADGDANEHEYEYQVGHRMEQAFSSSGSIKHLTVAVFVQGAPAEVTREGIEQLVANAIGIDRARGDAVSVLLLPGIQAAPVKSPSVVPPKGEPQRSGDHVPAQVWALQHWLSISLIALLAVLALLVLPRTRRSSLVPQLPAPQAPGPQIDVDAMTLKVRQWLTDGSSHGSH
jgi:flagellar M-ring protein FliF